MLTWDGCPALLATRGRSKQHSLSPAPINQIEACMLGRMADQLWAPVTLIGVKNTKHTLTLNKLLLNSQAAARLKIMKNPGPIEI